MKDEASVQNLRQRRLQLAVSRERAEMRERFGEKLVRAINEAASKALNLEDFKVRPVEPPLVWPEDIRDAPGLVRAYVAKSDAARTMSCVGRALGSLAGALGFHEKDYLGFACVTDFALPSMVAIAASTMDSVVFHAESPEIVVLVDCYGNGIEEQFSVVIQGRGIPGCIRKGFSEARVLRHDQRGRQ